MGHSEQEVVYGGMDRRIVEKFQRELGETIRKALEDEKTEDIALNPDGNIWVKQRGGNYAVAGTMLDFQAKLLMGTIAYLTNREVNSANPILEVDLPIYNARFEGIYPPAATMPCFSIRTRNKHVVPFDRLIEMKIITPGRVGLIEEAITQRKNILVSGGTGSGKTTFANAILEAQSRLTGHHRTLLIEDTPELNCNAPNTLSLLSSIDITINQLLRATLRLDPDRIIVGEVRGAEALTLITAWNTGHPGGLATLHANSADRVMKRLETLIAMAGVTPDKELIAESIDIVIYIERNSEFPAGRQVTQMVRVLGWDAQQHAYKTESL